ncbi:MAG TPA: EAL domain-containing protein [Rhodanobacteraceae bacterium]|nr:EAL domain-containing protein [Rhodanobacteraceae bacterium]
MTSERRSRDGTTRDDEHEPPPDGAAAPTGAADPIRQHDFATPLEAEHYSRDYLATHDPVSGLVRQHVFERNLGERLIRAINRFHRLTVCYLDIDKFGVINETYGFGMGDLVIRQVAARLAGLGCEPELMCRMAGDEFLLVLTDPDGDLDADESGQRFLQALNAPLSVGPMSLRLTASIGVASFPDTAASVQELMQQASAGARVARRMGGDQVHVFTNEERTALGERLGLGAMLRGVVERGELELHYLPVIGAGKHAITGMEALVRWRSPVHGLVLPGRFISLAEDIGMIAEIGQWVLSAACVQARRWLDAGAGDFTMSVNVSGMQMHGQRLLEDVRRALDSARLPARYLELELTESVIMRSVDHIAFVMKGLRKMGVTLAMDDFGIGHSCLGHLHRFPVSRLKIDRSFVSAVPNDVSAARICRAIIGLAHEFGYTVVAEGVETPLQMGFLERNGCESMQGHLFSSPVDADAMLALLRRPSLRTVESVEAPRSESGSLLLVDDEQNVVRALARLLRRDGYEIHTAGSFREAFELLGQHAIDVVVSDHRMPDGKGTDFLARVKETHPATVRMILSGYADIGVVTEAINGGAVYRFLTKPWRDEELRKTISEAVRMAGRSRDSDERRNPASGTRDREERGSESSGNT